ncbi:MAG TPA: sugar kinase [Firmicutes bacterium]|nr:sugar kinase [Bacillota bacterium]
MKLPEMITIGESMVVFSPNVPGPLRYVPQFTKHVAGAESNVCVGLTRLGHSAGFIGRLGDDEFGHYIVNSLRGEGVDVSQVEFDPLRPTGIYFKERRMPGQINVYYYRHGSAGSHLTPEILNEDYFASAKILHLTGITPALSDSCRETVFEAIRLARKHGLFISFDPNIRLKLWSKEEAKRVLTEIISQVDLLLPGLDEGEIIFGTDTPESLVQAASNLGVQKVVVKLGASGCYVWDGKPVGFVPGYAIRDVVDPVGAGDGFAAGLLSGILDGLSLRDAADLGNAVGAYATTTYGDAEGLPTRRELRSFLTRADEVER